MELKKYTPACKKDWDLFIAESLNGNFLYFRGFLDYHADRFQDHSLLAYEGNKLVALMPANEVNQEFHSHQGVTYGGWVMKKRFNAVDFMVLYNLFEKYLIEQQFKKAIIKLKPWPFAAHFNESEDWVLWNNEWNVIRKDLSFAIDLHYLPGFARDRRYRYNKSTRNNLRIVWSPNVDEIISLTNQNLIDKFGVSAVHNIHEAQLLQDRFPKNIHSIGVYQDDQFLGGTWLFEDASFIHTQYLHTNNVGKELCAAEFLIHELIETYKGHKRYLSFGTSTENNGRKLNTGLADFKEGFGASTFVHDFYEKLF